MFVTLSFSNTSRARSWRFARAISKASTPDGPHALDLGRRRGLDRRERRPFQRGERQRVEKRLLGREERAGDGRGEPALDERRVKPRLPLRRRATEARPQIDALGAGQHRIEDEHREEVGVGGRRRVKDHLHVARRALALDEDPPLAELRGLHDANTLGLGPRRYAAEMRAQHAAARRPHRRRPRRRASRCSGCRSGDSGRTGRRASST